MKSRTQLWVQENAWRVLDTVVDSIVIIDAVGIIQYVNHAVLTMFGFEEKELLGMNLSILMPAPYSQEHQKYIERYLHTQQAHVIGVGRELEAQTKAGRQFPIQLSVSEIKDSDKSFFAGIIHDLSEQKAAHSDMLDQQVQLAHAGRLSTMGELTASIAHEINQPLTAIALYAQACIRMLEKESVDKDNLSSALNKLVNQSLRAGAVIERVQRFVRKEHGQKESININSLVMDLLPLVQGDARLHGIELSFSTHPDLHSVYCDPIQIQQVALNLIRNAVDAMVEVNCENGNVIEVSTSSLPNKGVQVSVKDSGSGVAEEQAALIFSAFHTTKVDGMGMGLSICRSIIEQHDGILNFENNVQTGARFYFQLPVGSLLREQ